MRQYPRVAALSLGQGWRMRAVEVIAAKRDREEVAPEALREFVLAYAREDVADYQMAAFLMAGYVNGFSRAEAVALTAAMLDSGGRLDLSGLEGPTVDKHSTGGVGDGTTLVLAPLAAALGMQVVKLSGRGLGHTGGTLDKLDAIPGMRTELSQDELVAQVQRIGLAVCAQTADLVPADKAMYALRDVTATVDDIALIAASVMSKKLAGGAEAILLDVKVGSGAFMKEPDRARELAELCVGLGEEGGKATAALITDMSQPLADAVGNATEVREAIEVLRGERPGRFADLCVALAGHLAALAGVADDPRQGCDRAGEALSSGAALERFGRFVEAQGGDPRIVDDASLLPQAPVARDVRAGRDGTLAAVDAEAVGRAAAGVGAGRQRKEDEIDLAVGVDFTVRIGDAVEAGTVVARVLANDDDAAREAGRAVLAALTWADGPIDPPPLVHAVIGV
jgi:pyrimidine-nucleoside phosphorylase